MTNEIIDCRNIISDYVFNSKYARLNGNKKETWSEAVTRVMLMHYSYLESTVKQEDKELFNEMFNKAWEAYDKKQVLGSQRALQFGGDQLLKHVGRLYNCTSSYLNRLDFFEECMYLLLCGCGTGYSVQKCHTDQLPEVLGVDETRKELFVISDSIEGWSGSIGKLVKSYYNHTPKIEFDYSKIRKRGSYISGGFRAPGPDPLIKAHKKIEKILSKVKNRKLRPFELHYITCIISDAVISGGIRRSAMIALFDVDDKEMMECKTGDWFSIYPELGRCNNSVSILPGTEKEVFNKIFESTKEYGEPGIVFSKSSEYIVNPCCEVSMLPQIKKENGEIEYGWSFCNLSEVNGAQVKTEEDFYESCEAASILGTLQAAYTDFKVLKKASIDIAKRDALIGVSINGMCENPDIIFNPEIQRKGAKIVKKTNKILSEVLGINNAARTTVIKPSGNSSQLLGTSPGIHAFHFQKYIRHIQVNNDEDVYKHIKEQNPSILEPSVYNTERESVLSFPVTIPENAIVREKISTLDFLEKVRSTQMNWIEEGTDFEHPSSKENPSIRMNVSNTISVKENEWDEVREYVWDNRECFTGLSFLPDSGDLDYPQAPYTSYLDERELVEKYGRGAILSSGLIVDGLSCFDGNIYTACSAALGTDTNSLQLTREKIVNFIKGNINDDFVFQATINGLTVSDTNAAITLLKDKIEKRIDWVRRFKSFAERFFDGDLKKCSYCLKHVNIFHKWNKVKDQKPIDWSNMEWEEEIQEAGSHIGAACGGGGCLI